jgi:hypothetical protein
MVFKNEMWIQRPCLCVRPTGAINRARTVGGVNAAPTPRFHQSMEIQKNIYY